jgi:hypothetical protein
MQIKHEFAFRYEIMKIFFLPRYKSEIFLLCVVNIIRNIFFYFFSFQLNFIFTFLPKALRIKHFHNYNFTTYFVLSFSWMYIEIMISFLYNIKKEKEHITYHLYIFLSLRFIWIQSQLFGTFRQSSHKDL